MRSFIMALITTAAVATVWWVLKYSGDQGLRMLAALAVVVGMYLAYGLLCRWWWTRSVADR